MNEQLEVWSLPWHLLQRSLADTVPVIPHAVDVKGASQPASLSLSWLARARAPVQLLARRGQ
jgi:hypothetical protein